MGDPLSLVLDLAKGLLSRVKDVKNNHEECQFLEDKIEQTLTILERLEGTVFDFPTNTVLELVRDALINAKDEVDKCCNTSLINSVLYTDSQALDLKHATEKLEHALSQVPLAQLRMAADMQSDMVDLATQIRTTKFQEGARAARHAIDVKNAVEKASNQSSQENAEIKNLIKQVLLEHSLSKDDIRKELVSLQQELDQLKQKRNDGKDYEVEKGVFKFETIIPILSESSAHVSQAATVLPDLEDYFRCPISKQIMKNPVMLKESGVVYDQPSIEDWLAQGHDHDYVKNTRLETKEVVHIPALRVVCQSILEQFGAKSSTIDTTQEESKNALEPGLYEGRGRLCIDSTIAYTTQLLIVEPSRGVVGCTSYKGKAFRDQGNSVEIGAGKWDGSARKLSFLDNQYCYEGSVELLDNPAHATLKWNANVSIVENPQKLCASTLVYSPPFKGPNELLYPTILQCEGNVDTTTTRARYKSKLILSLEVDFTIGGWTCFESGMQEEKLVGHIVEGEWDDDGHLKFSIHFCHENNGKNLDSMPLGHIDAFDVAGFIKHGEGSDLPFFTSVVTKAKRDSNLRIDKTPTPLSGLQYWKCSNIYEASNDWLCLLPRPSKLFQVSRNLELERSQCNRLAIADVEHSLGSQLHHELAWSPLHSASANNSVSIITELIANGADVDAQDENGWTPLHIASQKNHVKIVKKLIANGANINMQDNKGSAPIHLASYENSFDVVKELIDGGAKVDLQDNIGRTPLHIAAKRGQTSIVRILLEHGASKDVSNAAGMTPYDFVCVGRCLLPFAKDTIEELKAILEA